MVVCPCAVDGVVFVLDAARAEAYCCVSRRPSLYQYYCSIPMALHASHPPQIADRGRTAVPSVYNSFVVPIARVAVQSAVVSKAPRVLLSSSLAW